MPEPFRFQGQVYRAHNPKWAWAPESGEGARQHGGRFNPAGMPALYTSMDYKTAWLEAQQGFPFKPQPLTLCAYEVDCEHILDLTQQAVRVQLGLGDDELAAPWEDQVDRGRTPPTHSLARRLIDEGIAGIIVPCFAPGADSAARNLVFWDWGRRRPHCVRVIDDEGRLQNQSD
jgi:RES domain-containing protein